MPPNSKDPETFTGGARWKMRDGRLSLVCLDCDQVIGTSTQVNLSHFLKCPIRPA